MRRFLRRTFLIVGTIVVVLGYAAMFLSAFNTPDSATAYSRSK